MHCDVQNAKCQGISDTLTASTCSCH